MEDKKLKMMNDSTDMLHHVGLVNKSLDESSARYEQLGFSLTPVSLPKIALKPGGAPETLGAGNRHAIFTDNYLELLGVVDPKRWSEITREQRGPFDLDLPLKRYEGLHVMHFGTDHIERVKERLDKQHTPSSSISAFQRNVQTENGERTMRARTIHFPPGSNPEALLQIAQHDTPELIFQDRYMHHRNGATALTEIMVCAEDPATYASKYEQYTGHKIRRIDDHHFVIDLGLSKIRIVSPKQLDSLIPDYTIPILPFLPAFTIKTSSLQLVRSVLSANLIPFSDKNNSIIVYPEYACGSAIIFETR